MLLWRQHRNKLGSERTWHDVKVEGLLPSHVRSREPLRHAAQLQGAQRSPMHELLLLTVAPPLKTAPHIEVSLRNSALLWYQLAEPPVAATAAASTQRESTSEQTLLALLGAAV